MHAVVGWLAVHCWVGGSESGVNRRAVEVVVLGMCRCRRGRGRRVASSSCRRVALGHLGTVWCSGGRSRCRRRGLMRCRVGGRLNLWWAGLRFENRVVPQAVAFAFRAIAAGRVSLVALQGVKVSACTLER